MKSEGPNRRQTGFGIIGTGTVAAIHARAIQNMETAYLAGVFDSSGERAGSFAQENHCRAYSSLEEMAGDPRIEFVTICTPSGAHLEPAVFMATRGKHLILEKPLEITRERCDQIIAAAERSGVFLSGIFQNRFHPAFQKLKQAVDRNRFGTISLASAYVKWFREQNYYDGSPWRGTWALDGGGALMNQSIHVIDLLLWLMGPVAEVKALAGTLCHRNIEVEDTLTGIFRFRQGALGTVEATTGAWPGSFKKIEICGDRGHAIVEDDTIVRWEFLDQPGEQTAESESPQYEGDNPSLKLDFLSHRKQFQDCLEAVEQKKTPSVTAMEARAAVDLVLILYENAGLEKGKK